jgi:thiol:disulfide interchange protein DsbA
MKKNIILSSFLLLIISISVAAEYRLGRDYGSLSRPLPVKEDGVVDVVEVFWYGCGHCFNLAPITAKWAKEQDSTVNYQKMPCYMGPCSSTACKTFLYH